VLTAQAKIIKIWHEWNFALCLFFVLLLFELILTGLILINQPHGYSWIGTGVFNTGDIPVYLSYINQTKHSWLVYNLFDHDSYLPRFDGFWSLGGKLTLLGLSAVWTHEILRWLGTLILALAVWATAKTSSPDLKRARVTSWLMLSGLSTGWLYSVWMGLTESWTPGSVDSPDLATELAIAPILTGGAHGLLSIALQLLITRWIWEILVLDNKKKLIPTAFAILYIAFFHPYFIPVYALIALISLSIAINKKIDFNKFISAGLLIGSAIPGAGYFMWLAWHNPSFKNHHLQINQLPLDAWYFWVITLWPFALALAWLYSKRSLWLEYINVHKLNWVIIWLISAIICMLLPLPWTRKYTQGLLPVLILVTLPCWLFIYDKIKAQKIIFPLKAALIIFLAFPYIHLIQTQIHLTRDPFFARYFYVSNDLKAAWKYLENRSTKNTMIITTDGWINYLTPAFTGQYVWLGHHHESPDFDRKLSDFNTWLNVSDAKIFNNFLNDRSISIIISTNASRSSFVTDLADEKWQRIFTQNDINVWSSQ